MMFKAQIFASFLLLISATLGVSARPNVLVRGVAQRSPSPTVPAAEDAARWSNARRLAAGLKPRKPRNLFDPSRVLARSPVASPLPQQKCWIFVDRADTPGWNKYVSQDHNVHDGWYDVDVPVQKRMVVSVPLTSGPINLSILSGSTYPFLGFAGDSLDDGDIHPMTDTAATPPGSIPQPVGNSLSADLPNSESAVWFYDAVTQRFTAQWIQPDGSVINPKFWYVNNEGKLGIVKDDLEGPAPGWEVYLSCEPFVEAI